jgi:hypothetical protein
MSDSLLQDWVNMRGADCHFNSGDGISKGVAVMAIQSST